MARYALQERTIQVASNGFGPLRLRPNVFYEITDRAGSPASAYNAETGGSVIDPATLFTNNAGLTPGVYLDPGRYLVTFDPYGDDPEVVEVEAIIGGPNLAVDASATGKGVVKLSVAPASATNPIALGANDPSVERTTNKGAANGYPSLDSSGKLPVAQLPVSTLEYKGTWNASSNTPALNDDTGRQGDMYRVTVAGSQNLGSGSISFAISDYVIHNGSSWEKAHAGADVVSSVAGKTGAVTLGVADVSGAETTANKNQANGYAGLDADSKIPSAVLREAVAYVTDRAYAGGAKGDGVELKVSMSLASPLDVVPSAGEPPFTSADVLKKITIPEAGASGAAIQSTIQSVAGGVATIHPSTPAVTAVTDVKAAYGTKDDDAFLAAAATGLPVKVPGSLVGAKYYVQGQIAPLDTTTPLRLIGEGASRTTILHPSTTLLARIAGSYDTAVSLTANVALGDTSITVSSTSSFRKGDYLRLRSEAQWDPSLAPGITTKKGEIVRVAGITSGTVLALAGRVNDSYATADSAVVDKVNYTQGNRVEGITFQNTTPNYSTGGGLQFKQCEGRVVNCVFRDLVGAGVDERDCRDFYVEGCRFSDGYALSAGSGIGLGYGVAFNAACINSWVVNSTAIRGHGVMTTSSGNSDYGVPRFVGADSCRAEFFYNQPFHTHQQGEYVHYINCVASNGSAVNSGGFVDGFGLYAKKMTLTNCVYENSHGRALFVNSSATDALIVNQIVRRIYKGTNNACAIDVNASDCTIKGGLIDGVTDSSWADNTSGSGIHIASGALRCHVLDVPIKNTSGHAISHEDATDSAVIDGVSGINNGGHVIWGPSGASGKWRNIRTVNSGLGTTNRPGGLMSYLPQRDGGAIAPGWGGDMPMATSGVTLSPGRGYAVRFVAPRDMNVVALAFLLATAAGSNDTMDVAILDASTNLLRSAGGAVAGKLNAAAGWVTVALSSAYMVRQGVVYYLALSSVTPFGSSAAVLRGPNVVVPMGENLGTGAGIRDMGMINGVGATFGSGPFTFIQGVCPYMKVIEG